MSGEHSKISEVLLKMSDDKIVSVSFGIAQCMETVKSALNIPAYTQENQIIAVLDVDSETMYAVIEWLSKHLESQKAEAAAAEAEETPEPPPKRARLSENKPKDMILDAMTNEQVCKLLLASNYLGIDLLIEAITTYLANAIAACGDAKEVSHRLDLSEESSEEEGLS